ncbi:uncharacterized protein STEHIDRAFT_150941 [Stereum hirsutum FP-91666 SS1]|uniref:Uncharacterized protein n=1 Tax=Stereum hirsutum (strain FP-91666) TaxID=721885 RepID=R7RX58_STEHR|nr:uncharacterized protein STEHIDRAFT_150941 [Stereum hirsutum FP-91666 SS1]EIM79445.1 hypothetical protein STEHIDRAFT_150941 [Stereum hirsutum FP-91666 SS1]
MEPEPSSTTAKLSVYDDLRDARREITLLRHQATLFTDDHNKQLSQLESNHQIYISQLESNLSLQLSRAEDLHRRQSALLHAELKLVRHERNEAIESAEKERRKVAEKYAEMVRERGKVEMEKSASGEEVVDLRLSLKAALEERDKLAVLRAEDSRRAEALDREAQQLADERDALEESESVYRMSRDDEVQKLRAEMESLRREVDASRDGRSETFGHAEASRSKELERAFQSLKGENEELKGERSRLIMKVDKVMLEMDGLVKERDTALAARDLIKMEKNTLASEAALLTEEVKVIGKEKEALLVADRVSKEKYEVLVTEKAAIAVDRDGLRRGVEVAANTGRAERDALRGENEDWRRKSGGLALEVKRLMTVADELQSEKDSLLRGNAELQEKCAVLMRDKDDTEVWINSLAKGETSSTSKRTLLRAEVSALLDAVRKDRDALRGENHELKAEKERVAARKRSEDGELIKLEQFVERLQARKKALEKRWNKEARGVPGFEKGDAGVQALGKDGQKNSGSALDQDEPSLTAPQVDKVARSPPRQESEIPGSALCQLPPATGAQLPKAQNSAPPKSVFPYEGPKKMRRRSSVVLGRKTRDGDAAIPSEDTRRVSVSSPAQAGNASGSPPSLSDSQPEQKRRRTDA